MKNWTNPEMVELSFTQTAGGDKPEFPLDGIYTDGGFPYGADNS